MAPCFPIDVRGYCLYEENLDLLLRPVSESCSLLLRTFPTALLSLNDYMHGQYIESRQYLRSNLGNTFHKVGISKNDQRGL